MDLIPLVDLPNTRDFLVAQFQREHKEALDYLARDISALIDSRKKVTPNALAAMQDRYDSQVRKAEEYVRLLGLSQTETEAAAEVAAASLEALADAALDSL